MRILLPILSFFLVCTSCATQTGPSFWKEPIVDFSEYPFYYDMTLEQDDGVLWKAEFDYMDSVNLSAITYHSDGLAINGFMVEPKKKGKYPVIINNRGGSFDFGAHSVATVAYGMAKMAAEGYIVIGSQYRGNGGNEGAEEFGGGDVNDVLNLIPIVDGMPNALPERIGMYGWSRGGMMTYLALLRSQRIKAAVVGGAPTDFAALEADRPGFVDLIPEKEDKDEGIERRSPILWADTFPKDVPILVLHGNADWRVKTEHSLRMALEFEKYRVPYRLVVYEGADHNILEHREEMKLQVMKWFDTYLKGDTLLPNMEYHGR